MEVMDTTSTQTQESSNSPIAESSSPTTEVQSQNPATVQSDVPAIPQYTPNFKYMAGKKEHELPEYIRPVIKDEKTEKELKEVYEKAYGIDFVKSERARIQEQYKQLAQEANPLFGIAQKINYHRQRNDVLGIAREVGIDEDTLLRTAIELAKRRELQPEQKAVYDRESQGAQRAFELEQQIQALNYQNEQLQKHQTEAEYSQVTSAPEVASFIKAFDQRNGEGEFRAELRERGLRFYERNGYDAPVEQITKEIMNRYGSMSNPQAPSQASITQPAIQAQPGQPRHIPVIPNTGAGQSGPVAKKVQTIEDVLAVRKEKFGY